MSTQKNKNNKKGQLLERLVAILHEQAGVKVEKNVLLTPLGRAGKKREIDILLSSKIAGYPIQIPIECKNKTKKVGSPEIDAYIGKLQDIGLPIQLGIYVSVNGYTDGAIRRARKAGIKTLTFKGLTTEGESLAILDALKSIIYIMPILMDFSMTNIPEKQWNPQYLIFYDSKGNYAGTIFDLIFHIWESGQIPLKLGRHQFDIEIPDGWEHKIGEEFVASCSINVQLNLIGFIVLIEGNANEKVLINAEDQKIEKLQSHISFPTKDSYPVYNFEDEEQLNTFWKDRNAKFKVSTGRIRLPRMRFGNVFWPHSQQVQKEFAEFFVQTRTEDEIKQFQEKLANMERDYFKSVWDEV